MNKNIIITGILIACVILVNFSYSQTLTILDGGRINANGHYGVEVGDGVYEGGSTGSGHGHAGIWYGNHAGDNDPLLQPVDNGTANDPRVFVRVGSIEHEGSGSGQGLKHDYKSGTVYWSYSGYTNGNLLDVIKVKYYQAFAKSGLQTFPTSLTAYRGNAIGYNVFNLTGQQRNGIRSAAWEIWHEKSHIGYTWVDMINSDGPWDNSISDIEKIRCDGVPEVAQESYGLDVSCGGNIMTDGGFDNHNNLHVGSFGWDIFGHPEMCPKIQGHLSEESNHQNDGIPWFDQGVTHTTRNISGVPYIAGISVDYYPSQQKYNFYMDIDDYGSQYLYLTIAGKYHTGEILLLLEGPTHSSPYTDVSKEIFFRKVQLSWTYTPTNQDPPNLPHNYAVHSFDWYGYCLRYNHAFVKYDMNYFSAFQIAIIDMAGNWILYEVTNPNYC